MTIRLWRVLRRIAWKVYERAMLEEKLEWQRNAERQFPRGSLVRCFCQRCGGPPHGRVWRVHSYDYDCGDLLVIDGRADSGFVNTPWPIPIINGIETTYLSTGRGVIEAVSA